jgi:hypothetical protein
VSQDTDPVPALARRAGRLSGPAQQVHRAVLAAFAATGGRPRQPPCSPARSPSPPPSPGALRLGIAAFGALLQPEREETTGRER